MLGQNVSGEIFVADRRIHKGRGGGENAGQPEDTGGAALLIRVGLGRLMIALVLCGTRFHLRAAIGFLNFRDERLARNRGKGQGTTQEQTEDGLERSPHRDAPYHVRLSHTREI